MMSYAVGLQFESTYLRVYARQRPGGVAWDAVPLTVRGLNKAAGNPPFSHEIKNHQIMIS